MPVNRCICLDVTFETLKRIAITERLDFDALRERTGCCGECGMCEPYVRKMLKTGRTSFGIDEPLGRRGGAGRTRSQ
jgi:bacterioferritin-associated ferredoxin